METYPKLLMRDITGLVLSDYDLALQTLTTNNSWDLGCDDETPAGCTGETQARLASRHHIYCLNVSDLATGCVSVIVTVPVTPFVLWLYIVSLYKASVLFKIFGLKYFLFLCRWY